jgi:hypothetical protein
MGDKCFIRPTTRMFPTTYRPVMKSGMSVHTKKLAGKFNFRSRQSSRPPTIQKA